MTQVNRRSALSVGLAAMAAFVAAASAYAQRQLPPGISLQAWGKRQVNDPRLQDGFNARSGLSAGCQDFQSIHAQ